MVIQLLIMAFLLLVIPAFVGGLLVDKKGGGLLFRWVSGQFLLWAGFQLICVALVLKESDFSYMVILFWIYMTAMALLAAASAIKRRKGKFSLKSLWHIDKGMKVSEMMLWACFWAILLFQLIQAARLCYADGDDAYYVAISAITQDADTMYRKLPYTGGETGLDIRHGLAPFPIWISFLARASGMPAVQTAQVVLPIVLISMTYGIFYLLGNMLFTEKGGQIPLFLIFTELGVLFGDYSFYTMENFMIARSRQGKAALGSIVIPFLLLVMMTLLKKLQEKEKIPLRLYLLLGTVTVTGCLCSTLGALLICMAVGTVGVLAAACYKRPGILLPLAACCAPCVLYALLYLLLL